MLRSNSSLEIADAYKDLYAGRYGTIDYKKQRLNA
jgi:hypothetical protein